MNRMQSNPDVKNLAVVLGMFETGLGVGRSLGREGIHVVGLDSVPKVGFHSRYIDARICPSPLEDERGFIEYLKDLAGREMVRSVLFITSDEYLLPVSRNRRELEPYFLMNLPDERILECISDKYRQHALALDAGIPVPKTFLAADMEEFERVRDEVPLPAFIKGAEVNQWRSRIGVATKGFTASTREELENTLRMVFGKGAKALIQEIIPGPDTNHFKSSCYISRDGSVLLAFGLQKIRQQPVGFGFGCLVQSVEYPEMVDLGKRFLTRIGYRGVGSVEFKRDQRDGSLKMIELNPRYWQQNALPARCGMNFPLVNYMEMTGQDTHPLREYRSGVKWVNIYSDIESFREYRKRGLLSGKEWLRSLKGELMLSDLEWDDPLPGLHEIGVVNLWRRTKRYVKKVFG